MAKTQQQFKVICMKFVVSRQWTVVQFPIGLLVFVKDITLNDDQKPGRPKTSTDEQSVKLMADFLAQDHQATCKEISQATRISPTSVFHILANYLQKRNICARWVPHCLTAE
jgi:hypothetical protein